MDLAQEKKTFLNKFKEADSQDSLNSLKIEYLGKKGVLSSLMSQLSNAPRIDMSVLARSLISQMEPNWEHTSLQT